MTCIFCQVISGQAPGEILYRDEQVTAFRDKHPITSTHVLIVPNRHIESVNVLEPGDESLVGHMVLVARRMAAETGVDEKGYRLIMNTGAGGGQTVFHLHLHLVAGKWARLSLG